MEQTGEKPSPSVVVSEVGTREIGGLSAAPHSPPAATVTGEAAAPPPPTAASVDVVTPATDVKTKRGRPMKCEGQGGAALSPIPISASIPLSGYYSGENSSQGRAPEPSREKHKSEFDCRDQLLSYATGSTFKSHILNVNTGEDVTSKIITFVQQRSSGICVLSATGSISIVTLRRRNSSGGTLTHEGCFNLMSLRGSFIMNDNGESKSRSGGICVKLAARDGQILAGGLAGPLIAATPVQVIVGTFLHGRQQEQEHEPKLKRPSQQEQEHKPKHKRPRTDTAVSSFFTSLPTNIIFRDGFKRL